MSGPKVVRIVTPQERQIIKNRWLSRLAHEVQKTIEYAQKNDVLDENLKKELEKRVTFYENLSIDDYLKIEREVPEQINFLKEERKKLHKKVTQTRASTWEVFKNLKSTHNELTAILTEKGIPFKQFETPTIISKDDIALYQIQVDNLYNLLKKSVLTTTELSEEQRLIQQRLSKGDSLLSVNDWKSEFPETQSRLQKLERTLKEMYVNDMSQHKIQALIQRCADLDTRQANYNLQLDSLIIDAANFTKNELALRDAREDLSNGIQLIETLDLELNFIVQWKEKIQSTDLEDIQQTAIKAREFYENTSENIIVEARRKAIKTALEKAGYEVNDTMETAWVENGRLVVKKATNSLYGIEFMSPNNLSRIQARVVADENRSSERSPSLDKNQEEIWCDDFYDIRAFLAEEDLDIIIDTMKEPGAVPIKEVSLHSGYASRDVKVNKKKQQ